MESTVIQIRAFIDFAQKLSCSTLGYLKPIDGTKDFYKIIEKFNSPKSNEIYAAFSSVDESWGRLIRSLRDKILHYDFIKSNHEFRPKLQGQTYEQFAQEMTNNMFSMLIKLNKTLFDIKWIAGTYEEFKKVHNR